MTDKMREGFEKWAKAECLDLGSVGGFYSDNDTHLAWGTWQAAKSDSELSALRKDAERYKWLSYNASYGIHEMLFGKPAFYSTHKESDLAECIDEQIAAEKKND